MDIPQVQVVDHLILTTNIIMALGQKSVFIEITPSYISNTFKDRFVIQLRNKY